MITPSAHMNFLHSDVYRDFLDPEHLTDLRRSGLSDSTIREHGIRTVPPQMISQLLGFDWSAIRSAYILPYPSPDPDRRGWMSHVSMKIFPTLTDRHGRSVKYLGRSGASPRLYFPRPTLSEALSDAAPLWLCEGVKKALAVAQLGLPVAGFSGVEGWHVRGSRALLPDFDAISLKGRTVELVPDGDVRTNDNVCRGIERFGEALEARGARVRVVLLPLGVAA